MLKIVSMLVLTTLVSCASRKGDVVRLDGQIQAEDAKSFDIIRSHFQQVLDAHPELNEEAKHKIRLNLDKAMIRQQSLKDDESKVVQLLLKKSLTFAQLTKPPYVRIDVASNK